MTKWQIIKLHKSLLSLSIWTHIFGLTLAFQQYETFQRLTLFNSITIRNVVTFLMIFAPTLNVLSVIMNNKKKQKKWVVLNKWALITVASTWVLVTWAYLINDIPNVGYIMSSFIAVQAYTELGRGDFSY